MVSSFSQMNRPLRVHTPLGPDALLLTSFQGRESLSQLFSYHLTMVAPRPTLLNMVEPIDFAKIMGKHVTVDLEVQQGHIRHFGGIVQAFTEGKRDDQFITFEAEVVPDCWLLTRTIRSRVFQELSVPAILRRVFEGFEVEYRLTDSYPSRDRCVQYRESDFDFASRLMEEEGIFYYFEHTDKTDTLVVADNMALAPRVAFDDTVVFEEIAGGSRWSARLTSWRKTQQLQSSGYTCRDYHFQQPREHFEANEVLPETVSVGSVEHHPREGCEGLEHCDSVAGFAKRYDSIGRHGEARPDDLSHLFEDNHRTAHLRIQELATESIRIEADSNATQMQPGHSFTLINHYDGNGDYYVTEVTHQARLTGGFFAEGEPLALEYKNQLGLRPEQLPYRPARRTSRPVIPGTQTAKVVGPEGSPIFVDKYGRIKVQFHWDRMGTENECSSCWIRVAQVWAGKKWGAFFWPRVGHEVVVSFEDGDPDRPLVVGSVYNADNMPPFELPELQTVGGIKSNSLGTDRESIEEFNAVLFHDSPGDEHVQVRSQTHEILSSGASKFSQTLGPEIEFVGNPLFPVGSGVGGGILDFGATYQTIAGSKTSPGWLAFSNLFPGSSKYTFGGVLKSTIFGDNTSHIFGGGSVSIMVDPEAMLWEKVFGSLPTVGALLTGTGGANDLTIGPKSSLHYYGPSQNILRGQSTKFHTHSFLKDTSFTGKVAIGLATVITITGVLSDLATRVLTAKSTSEGEYMAWASLITQSVVGRMLAWLQVAEQANAESQQAEGKLKEAQAMTEQMTNLLHPAMLDPTLKKFQETLLRVTEFRVKQAKAKAEQAIQAAAVADAKAGQAQQKATAAASDDKEVKGPYTVTGTNLSLLSKTSHLDQQDVNRGKPSDINITAEGGGDNGSININASKEVLLGRKGENFLGISKDSINLVNGVNGTTTLLQGRARGTPKIQLESGPSSSIALSVGLPDVGSSIELKSTGLTLKFGKWSLTMNNQGIALEVGPSKLLLKPDKFEMDVLTLVEQAELTRELKGVKNEEKINALNQQQAALEVKN